MDSPVNTKPTDPQANPALSTQEMELVSRADQRLAHAYEQIVRADEELARFNEQISRLEKKSANKPRRSSRGSPALRGVIGLLLTAGICTAAFAWQSYGETVRPMVSRWVPQLASDSSSPSAKPTDQQGQPAVQLAAANTAASQLPAPADTAAQEAAAAAAAEQTQLLQTMARDLASVQQEIEQLKASQVELARESAKTAEQLKANQEQMARVIANASEQSQRPRASAATPAATSANPPRPVATPARKPVSTVPPTQARAAQARAPVQARQQ